MGPCPTIRRRTLTPGAMNTETGTLVPRYRLCTGGYWLSAFALGLLCLSEALFLWVVFTRDRGLFELMQQSFWTWAVEMPISAGALIGSYLLWGRWTDRPWQRRAGLLVALNLFDFGYWAVTRFDPGGAFGPQGRHEWLFSNLTMIFGWLEFYLFADLAAEVAWHLGVQSSPESGRTARLFAIAGMIVSIGFFLAQTRWAHGWPLIQRPIAIHPEILIRLGVAFLRLVSAMQVVVLCYVAGDACRRTARTLADESQGDDPFSAGHDLGDPFNSTGAVEDDFHG